MKIYKTKKQIYKHFETKKIFCILNKKKIKA